MPGLTFAVIGMGRLGGYESNYLSDADVLFVYDPPEGVSESAASAAAHAIAEELRRLLGMPAPDPPLGVDADLRPEGRQGPLVRSLAAYQQYYARWSRVWEAQALLRARCVCGDADLGTRFEQMVDPIRYPADGLTREQAIEIRRIKVRVETERLPRGADPATHTKLGRGGLADVEWAVQLLQLRHAGAYPQLRGTRTLDALGAARDAGLVDPADAEAMTAGWTLAAQVRNALMLVRGRAGDQLPGTAWSWPGWSGCSAATIRASSSTSTCAPAVAPAPPPNASWRCSAGFPATRHQGRSLIVVGLLGADIDPRCRSRREGRRGRWRTVAGLPGPRCAGAVAAAGRRVPAGPAHGNRPLRAGGPRGFAERNGLAPLDFSWYGGSTSSATASTPRCSARCWGCVRSVRRGGRLRRGTGLAAGADRCPPSAARRPAGRGRPGGEPGQRPDHLRRRPDVGTTRALPGGAARGARWWRRVGAGGGARDGPPARWPASSSAWPAAPC